MDYQEPSHPQTIHIRYSSDFRETGGRYVIASKSADAATKLPTKATLQRDPAEYPALGGIVLKKLPAGWKAAKPDFYAHGSAKMFVAPKDSSCAIIMLYDVLRRQYRQTMKRLLEAPAKPVGDKDLQELIGFIPDYTNKEETQFVAAYTKDLDGKRVLVMEEKNIKTNRYYYFVYSSDRDVGYETYTQIWFVAPPEALAQYKKEAIDAINSLKFL